MPLAPGDHLGPFEILSKIGAGGMGEVWKARDTRLNREVAIKFSNEKFTDRFEREAKSIAALNHPNICHLYDVGENYLVMELIEGPTLAYRIQAGAIPLEESLNVVRQIAEALEAAHEKGIIHRDLKPANIKITPAGVVKVLDFGLAKSADAPQSDPEISPTMTISPTRAGMILGTAAYMSPEQARGKSVDKRADIWSFGCVLYEMITGKRAFRGETTSDILASVLKERPPLETIPARVRPVVERCLEKEPALRWRDIGDVRLLLDEDVPEQAAPRRAMLPWIVAGVCVAGLATAGWGWWRAGSAAPAKPFLRLDVDLGKDVSLGNGEGPTVAISPDGTRIAFVTPGTDGRNHLALRPLDSPVTTVLTGTEGAASPFFSPDSRWIAFFADAKLKKIAVEGGAPVTLCEARNTRGGAWGPDGAILFSDARVGLSSVSAMGGTPQLVTQLDAARGEFTHRFPQFLPRGDGFLFLTRLISAATGTASDNVYESAEALAQSTKTGKRMTLLKGGFAFHYLPTSTGSGHLVYMHQRTLFAAPMNPARLELTGPAVPVVEDIAGWLDYSNGFAHFDASATGTFVYIPAPVKWSFAMIDSAGTRQALPVPADRYPWFALSPDGTRLALAANPDIATTNISVYDFASQSMLRLASVRGGADYLTWAPDGKHLAFGSATAAPGPGIYWMSAQTASDPLRIMETPAWHPGSFSPDGKKLAIFHYGAPYGISILPLDLSDPEHPRPGNPEPLLQGPLDVRYPKVSPDGKWISYYAFDAAERRTVAYVQPFPGPGARVQVAGRAVPNTWVGGRQIFLSGPDGQIFVVDYTVSGGTFRASAPKPWLPDPFPFAARAMPDGKHIVAAVAVDQKPPTHVVLLVNFFDELRRRAPVSK
jgi:Tol biopolymer transport system component/predicted Ser/Thr protein kinase